MCHKKLRYFLINLRLPKVAAAGNDAFAASAQVGRAAYFQFSRRFFAPFFFFPRAALIIIYFFTVVWGEDWIVPVASLIDTLVGCVSLASRTLDLVEGLLLLYWKARCSNMVVIFIALP